MQEIRRRERVIPGYREQIIMFTKTMLPPLVAKYALQWLRRAAELPVVRAVLLGLLGLAAAFLILPALVVGVLAFLATGSAYTATMGALLIALLAAMVMVFALLKVYAKWKHFKLRYLR